MKRWLFHPEVEKLLSADKVAERILFHDAVQSLNRGHIVPKEKALHQLKALEEADRVADLLAALRECEGHASVVFPHCPSDARIEGHVIPVVTFESFKLQACSEDGRLGKQ